MYKRTDHDTLLVSYKLYINYIEDFKLISNNELEHIENFVFFISRDKREIYDVYCMCINTVIENVC